MKKVLITNILLSIVKFLEMSFWCLAAFIDDYIVPPTKLQQYGIFFIGIIIAIMLDLFVNYMVIKKVYEEENKKRVQYVKVATISIIITILEAIYIILS